MGGSVVVVVNGGVDNEAAAAHRAKPHGAGSRLNPPAVYLVDATAAAAATAVEK